MNSAAIRRMPGRRGIIARRLLRLWRHIRPGRLKRCPFCGNAAVHCPTYPEWCDGVPDWYVYCPNCGAQGPGDTSIEAAERLWNRRRFWVR